MATALRLIGSSAVGLKPDLQNPHDRSVGRLHLPTHALPLKIGESVGR